jgi:hypothetical protein
MREAAVHLLIGTPTDPKGLVDVPIYLERHFSTLRREICGRSLAFEFLKTLAAGGRPSREARADVMKRRRRLR